MKRYDVDRIVLALVEEGQDNSSKYGFGLGDVIRFTPMQVGTILSDLDIEPELIRCKDCKHYKLSNLPSMGMPIRICEYWKQEDVDDDDFCSRAERRLSNVQVNLPTGCD